MNTKTPFNKRVLVLAYVVIIAELSALVYYFPIIADWLSHNLWVVIIPFTKALFKRMFAMKLLMLLKGVGVLFWHLSKLLLLKILKTLGIRYGVFFSQYRWYWIRWAKVMFLRRGKQFFKSVARFWSHYAVKEKWVILIAFFPIGLVCFVLGLSFNVTRKTMVEKTQETAIFKVAKSAGANSGIRAWVSSLDRVILEKIQNNLKGKKSENTNE